ncbi:MAG: hypothetical protein ABSH15_00585 [Verrucomicrobiota bacterium]|jgi:hypothetical protein
MSLQNLTGLTSKTFLNDPRGASFLKRQALLFDQIAIIDLPALIETHRFLSNDQSQQYAAELEWLTTQEIIYEPDFPRTNAEDLFEKLTADPRLDQKMISLVQQTLKHEIACLEDCRKAIDLILRTGSVDKSKIKDFAQTLHLQIAEASELRHAAHWLTAIKGNRMVLAHSLPDYNLCSTTADRKAMVWEVILEHVPALQQDTPWERILEFRSDPDSRQSVNDLLHWVHTLASSPKTRDDVQEELAYLRARYEHAFKLHKLEFKLGIFEAVMEPMLAAAENLVKLKWSKLGDPFLKLKKHSLQLQKAEQSIPGREVSYLVKLEQTFEEGP